MTVLMGDWLYACVRAFVCVWVCVGVSECDLNVVCVMCVCVCVRVCVGRVAGIDIYVQRSEFNTS